MRPEQPTALLRTITLIGLILLTALTARRPFPGAQAGAEHDMVLPADFAAERVASGLALPTDMAFLPNGDLLIAEKGTGGEQGRGSIVLLQDPLGQARLVVVLTLRLNPVGDSGIMGIIPDPGFAENNAFYVYYPTTGTSFPWDTTGTSKYRLSRFTLDWDSLTVDPASERVLLDDIPRGHFHVGGALAFDRDGLLYLAVGDAYDASWSSGHVSQDLSTPLGKILRIRPTESGYEIPADNPFLATPGALPEIYALGLRNPFRAAQSPGDGRLFLGDVGYTTWEEVNAFARGANYGWPEREGPCPRQERLPCPPARAGLTDPSLYYLHIDSDEPNTSGAVTGLAFYESGPFPAIYHGMLFFADYNQDFIAAVSPEQGLYDGEPFARSVGAITDLEVHDGALYALDIIAGTVTRIFYVGPDQPLVARLEAEPALGPAPLTVAFSAAETINPSGAPLTYLWDFGDGEKMETTTDSTAHTYTADGDYRATLVARDQSARQSRPVVQEITVYSGAMPEIALTNLTEAGRELYYGGDRFRYEARRAGGTTGLAPDAPYVWDIYLLHNQHLHPILSGRVAGRGVLDIPVENHGGSNISYRLQLTMNTRSGQAITVSRDLKPALVNTTVQAVPPGLPVRALINGGGRLLPAGFRAIVGVEQTLAAPARLLHEGGIYAFEQWEGQPPGETEVVVRPGPGGATYTARYVYAGPQETAWLPAVVR